MSEYWTEGHFEHARWYAVQCLSNRELIAASQLRNQGFDVFLPVRLKQRRHARRLEQVRRPFFPGYLFVRLDLLVHRWRSINGTLGVSHLVAHGELPVPAPRGAIEAIRSICGENDVMRDGGNLSPGDHVRIAFGPFVDLVGELERLDGTGRVSVLLNLMGRHTSVVLPRDHIVCGLAAA